VLVAMLTRGIGGFRGPGKISSFDSPFSDEVRVADCLRIRNADSAGRSAVSENDRRVKNLDAPRADVSAVLKVRMCTVNFRRRLKI